MRLCNANLVGRRGCEILRIKSTKLLHLTMLSSKRIVVRDAWRLSDMRCSW